MKYNSEVLQELAARGFIYQCTDIKELDVLLSKEKIPVYIGFDITADSLHVGHLTQIFLLRIFQKHGHTPIILIGGGTTKIGDPTWKNEMRPLLSEDQLEKNMQGVKVSFQKFLSFDTANKAIIENNDNWLKNLNYIDFLRKYGVYFSVNKMIAMETFKQRLSNETNLSFLEFNYPLLQSFDFLELNKRFGCLLELGGSDQWGNITSGVDLVRRVTEKTVYGLTSPLLTTADGKKMGKTMSGAIWLNKEKLSPYDFWQYWRNVHDDDVVKFIRLFTDTKTEEIKHFESLKCEELNEAKVFLADSITTLCHGTAAVENIHNTLNGKYDESTEKAFSIKRESLESLTALDLALYTKLFNSNGEIKRLITNGGFYINDQQVLNIKALVKDYLSSSKTIKVGLGKKRAIIIDIQ